MCHPTSSATSDTSCAALCSTSLTYPAAGSVASLARHDDGFIPSSSLSLQAQDDARRGYVSPYPPLPTMTTMSSVQSSRTVSSMQLQPQPQPSLSASSTISSQEDPENARKQALITALNERRVNTIGELRRIERIFASLGHSDLTEPMTSAWVHYVNSNSLLTELRGLTRNYPFSSECVDEGKRRVHQDPASNRSWNYCWLILAKIHTDSLIPTYARAQAARPEMWGGRVPPANAVDQLAQAFAQEWSAALTQLLRS